jgi:pilus assembly protein TadC
VGGVSIGISHAVLCITQPAGSPLGQMLRVAVEEELLALEEISLGMALESLYLVNLSCHLLLPLLLQPILKAC